MVGGITIPTSHRIKLEIELRDTPGQLLSALEPIAMFGGNITGIYHERERKTGDKLPVVFLFELEDLANIERIREALESKNLKIMRYLEAVESFNAVVVLIGHVFATNIVDTLDRIMTYGVNVRKVSARINRPEDPSTVKLSMEADDREKIRSAMQELERICEEKQLTLIKSFI